MREGGGEKRVKENGDKEDNITKKEDKGGREKGKSREYWSEEGKMKWR